MQIFLVIIVALVVVLFWIIATYNSLITRRNWVTNAFSQIEVQLKRRFDLIPNLIESVRGYMGHEQETLEAVIAARSKAMSAHTHLTSPTNSLEGIKAVVQAESVLSSTLGRLLAIAESYPDLKANESIRVMMEELTSTENRISFARQAYNDFVLSYNVMRETFPSNLTATFFQFKEAQTFTVESEEERKNIQVSFAKK